VVKPAAVPVDDVDDVDGEAAEPPAVPALEPPVLAVPEVVEGADVFPLTFAVAFAVLVPLAVPPDCAFCARSRAAPEANAAHTIPIAIRCFTRLRVSKEEICSPKSFAL
jgi:hypothetical protein